MKTIAVEDTTLTAGELAVLAQKEVVVLTRNGDPFVAVKNLSGSDWESVSLASNPRFIELIEASRRSYREQGGIGLDAIRREFALNAKKKSPARQRGMKKKGGPR
jgi:hypothetical protein